MRRYWVVLLAVLTLLGVLSPPAFAQAPAAPIPKVTITGLVDNLVNWNQNLSYTDINLGGATRNRDAEMYGRTRGRFDIIGELGQAKAVLGLELDLAYGQVAGCDGKASSTGSIPTASGLCNPTHLATTSNFAADNDVVNVPEIKWMYVEFPFSGPGSLLPFIPFPGTMAVGGQPYALGLPPSILADSDFAGATIRMSITPTFKASLTYAQFEEAATGHQTGGVGAGSTFSRFGRGDDWGLILKADWQARKELTVSPIYAHQEIVGTTSSLIRRATGGYAVGGANFAPDQTFGAAPFTSGSVTPCLPILPGSASRGLGCKTDQEWRNWIGFDATYRTGPWYVRPDFFYQWGGRQRQPSASTTFATFGATPNFIPLDPGAVAPAARRETADISAWILDIETGYRWGPLLLQLRGLYTSGDKASDNLNKSIHYYQTMQTGNSYYAGWSEIWSPNVDYLTPFYSFSNSLSQTGNIGYDRYGRAQFTAKATYDWTPQLSLYFMVTPMWTATAVPTDKGFLTSSGVICLDANATAASRGVAHICDRRDEGNARHLGTDLDLGFTWRFAPGLAFDWVSGVLVAGPALDTNRCTNYTTAGVCSGVGSPSPGIGEVFKADAKNAYTTTARVRFSF